MISDSSGFIEIPLSISNQERTLTFCVDRKQNPHCWQWEHNSISDSGSVRFSRSWAICEYRHYGCDLFNLYSNLYEKRYTRRLCSVKQC